MLDAILIGCGRIGAHTAPHLRTTLPDVWFPYSHLDAAEAVDGLRIVAVCDRNEDAARSTAESHSVDRWYTDVEVALDETRPDIVLVATRMTGRSEIIEMAVRHKVRGIHFEKPLGGSIGECRRVMELAREAGVHVSYGAVRRYMDVPRSTLTISSSPALSASSDTWLWSRAAVSCCGRTRTISI